MTEQTDTESEPDSHPSRTRRGRWRFILITGFMVGWVGFQVLVPAVRTVERGRGVRPRSAGWQMFSHTIEGSAEVFVVETKNGRRRIDIQPLLSGPMRKEMLYAPAITAELCSRPEILAVEVTDAEWGTSTVTCR